MIERRQFLAGMLAAPAIVSAANIMPVRAMAWLLAEDDGLRLGDLGIYDGNMYRNANGRLFSVSPVGLISISVRNGVVSDSYRPAGAVYEHGLPPSADAKFGFKQVGILRDVDYKQWSRELHERVSRYRLV